MARHSSQKFHSYTIKDIPPDLSESEIMLIRALKFCRSSDANPRLEARKILLQPGDFAALISASIRVLSYGGQSENEQRYNELNQKFLLLVHRFEPRHHHAYFALATFSVPVAV